MLFFWYGGLVSYGGIMGGFVVAYLFLEKKKENIYQWFDLGIIGLLFGWSIGRIGCLLNGDSVGILSRAWFAIWGRIPTQLFESIWVLIVAAALLYILQRKEKLNIPDGIIFWAGILLYSVGRFVIDFYRDEKIFLLSLKAGQIGSILVAIISIIAIYWLVKLKRKEM